MRLIDADEVKRAFIGNRYGTKAIEYVIDNVPTVEIEEEVSEKIEKGYVIKQEIDEGTEVNAGEVVKIYVSSGNGKEQVVVPAIIGKTEEDAKNVLKESKLEVEVTEGENTVKPNGTVLKQSIEAGTTVEEGTKVLITINKLTETKYGTVHINVKSLTGYKEETPVVNNNTNTGTNNTANTGNTNATNSVDNTNQAGGNINTTNTTPTPKPVPTVKLKVTVTSEGETKTACDEAVLKTETDKVVSISGKGVVKVIVYLDGVEGGRTYELNLNEKDTLNVQ